MYMPFVETSNQTKRGVSALTPFRAVLLTLLASLAWGFGNISHKTVMQDLDGFAAAGFSALIGALLLLPFRRLEPGGDDVRPRERRGLGLLVSLAFTVAIVFQQFGFGHTTVTNAGFLVNTAAVITPIIAWGAYHEQQPYWIWPASLTTLAGVFLLAGGTFGHVTFGDALCLVSAVFFAWWTLLVREYVSQFKRPLYLTILQLAVCGTVASLLSFALHGFPTQKALLAAAPELICLGVFSKAFAYGVNAIAQQRLSATSSSVIVSAEAVFGAMFAALILAERLTWQGAAGALFILLGVSTVSGFALRGRQDEIAQGGLLQPVTAPARAFGERSSHLQAPASSTSVRDKGTVRPRTAGRATSIGPHVRQDRRVS
jgi:drug/metabolite transporter (DMT)-like permease